MRVAVLSLTRDRLEYTQHCFASLKEYAGCPYDHFVLDQGSKDGTQEWLLEQHFEAVCLEDENIGITAGVNVLLEEIDDYDVVVKVDNDCELTMPDTLKTVCELVLDSDALLSPRILGLRNPPVPQGEFVVNGERILDIPQIGGIFLAVPGFIYENGYRYDRHSQHEDDVQLCWWWREQGGRCGYVDSLEAWHYETTDGQWERYPEYFERRVAEGGRAW